MAEKQPDFKTKSLAEKLHYIQEQMAYLQKKGKHGLGYNYATEGDVLEKLKPLLDKARVLFTFGITSAEDAGDLARVFAEGQFINIDKPEEVITIKSVGDGDDYSKKSQRRGDKGIYKAITGSHKYMIMKMFHIETGDEPEAFEEEEVKPKPKPKPKQLTVDEIHKMISAKDDEEGLLKAATWLSDNQANYKDTDIEYLKAAITNRRAVLDVPSPEEMGGMGVNK